MKMSNFESGFATFFATIGFDDPIIDWNFPVAVGERNFGGMNGMTENEKKLPFVAQSVPFLIGCLIFGPIGLVILLFMWRRLERDERIIYLIVSIFFTLLEALDYFTDGIIYYFV